VKRATSEFKEKLRQRRKRQLKLARESVDSAIDPSTVHDGTVDAYDRDETLAHAVIVLLKSTQPRPQEEI
jgi:hypothetical protein